MSDYGIKTSLPGESVFNGGNLNFDTNNPFLKIDTQNAQGFKTITLLIVSDPPEPVGPDIFQYTLLHKFKHGYTYKPSLEALFYVTTPPPGTAFYQQYFQDAGVIGAHTAFDQATLWAVVDATWVYIICGKYKDDFGVANLLSGTNIQITTHVFVEDIGA